MIANTALGKNDKTRVAMRRWLRQLTGLLSKNREVRQLNRWYDSAQELPTTPTFHVSLFGGSDFPVFSKSFGVAWRGIPNDVRTLLAKRWLDLESDWHRTQSPIRIRVPFIAVTDPWEENLLGTLGLMVGVAIRAQGHLRNSNALRKHLSRVFLTYSITESETPAQWMPTVIAVGLADSYLKFTSGEEYSPVGFRHDDRYELAADWGFPVAAFMAWDDEQLMQDGSSDEGV